jgi:short-subunit dehydrogenase
MPSLAGARVLVVGATSTIARHTAEACVRHGAALHLGARNVEEAERIGRDLAVRHGAEASWSAYEATDDARHDALLDAAEDAMGGVDGVIVAVGMLGNQARAEAEAGHLRAVVDVNFASVAVFLERAAARLERQNHGWIAALSSVAGDRGRADNYAYGAAKAGLSAFLEGLRGRLYESGVHVLTVKPGPVDTAMTFGMDDAPPLMADPETVAADIVGAIEAGRDVCYTPGLWRIVMALLRAVPSRLFKQIPWRDG